MTIDSLSQSANNLIFKTKNVISNSSLKVKRKEKFLLAINLSKIKIPIGHYCTHSFMKIFT